jgi:hypothetical protein
MIASEPGHTAARKRFGEARDLGGIFGVTSRFRATETRLHRVSSGKAAKSSRLLRRPHESGFARDCVVGLVGLKPQPTGYGPKLIINGLRGCFAPRLNMGGSPK